MPPLTGLHHFAGDVLQLCRAYGAPQQKFSFVCLAGFAVEIDLNLPSVLQIAGNCFFGVAGDWGGG